jgi:hypothetical protein
LKKEVLEKQQKQRKDARIRLETASNADGEAGEEDDTCADARTRGARE